MAYLNAHGLATLWNKISSLFSRKSEAAGGISSNGATIYLIAVSGGTLDSVDLTSTIQSIASSEASSATSGYLKETTADTKYGRYLSYNSSTKTLSLQNANHLALDSVTIQ